MCPPLAKPARSGAPSPASKVKTELLNQATVCGFFRDGDYDGGGDAVSGLEVEQADSLSSAAGFADGARIHADDFAVLADEHDLGVFGYLGDAGDFAVALGG